MDYLQELENESIYIIREAYNRFRKIGLLWSMGKDSTTLLWLSRKAFFGKLPFPIIHIDTGYKFQEIYEFRKRYVREWGLNLIIAKNREALKGGIGPLNGRFKCCQALKTEALKLTLREHKFTALLMAIRRDEHGIRAKERYFSPRNVDFRWNYRDQPAELWNLYGTKREEGGHLRIHPMLHWREIDIWRYIAREKIPVISLYFAREGRRYRSIGCHPCCVPVKSRADNIRKIIKELQVTKEAERGGRVQDKEQAYMMEKLRSLGYM